MKSRMTVFLVALAFFGLEAAAMAATRGDSTHGNGELTTGGSAVTSFLFDAKVKDNGTVIGKARFYDASSLDVGIDVDCLSITGNTAIIGGTDKDSPSTTYAFKVIDNGGGATADRITLPQVNQTCATFSTLSTWALTAGDLEVDDQP